MCAATIAPVPTILASSGGNKTHFLDCDGLVPPYHRHLLAGGRPYSGELPGARRLTVAECALVQITETVPPEILFCRSYPYYSSVSKSLREHFAASKKGSHRDTYFKVRSNYFSITEKKRAKFLSFLLFCFFRKYSDCIADKHKYVDGH